MTYRKLLPLLALWEIFIWLGYNNQLLRGSTWILFDEQQMYEDLYIGGIYYNAETYMLVLAITSAIIIEYCLKGECAATLVRCTSRVVFCYKRWKTLIIVSIMYVLIHFSLGYILSFGIFQAEFVVSKSTLLFYAASGPLLFLFFLRVNMVYVLLRDFFNKKIFAMAGVLGIYLLEFFMGYYVLEEIWLPCKDVDMGTLAYFGRLGGLEFILALARQAGITLIIAILSLKYFDHKDVIEIEK